MAENPKSRLTRFTLHQRHMAELLFGALALLVVVVALGGYLYISGPHSQYHCPTVTVATARC